MKKTLFMLYRLPRRRGRVWPIPLWLNIITTCLFAQESAVSPFTGNLSPKDQITVDYTQKQIAVKRIQLVTLNQTRLRLGTFGMDLFEDIAIKCDTTSRRVKNGAIIIFGKTEKNRETGEFFISIFGKDVIINLNIGKRYYHLSRLSGNTYLVSEIDPTLLPPCGLKGGEK